MTDNRICWWVRCSESPDDDYVSCGVYTTKEEADAVAREIEENGTGWERVLVTKHSRA